ncbi:DUF4148 domain-containing protein [Burkholderia cepacia]|uniref:DUF4148 domain-containing protein n=1 Tax=Burkholderia cepacia TaxID=292 RepID=UPI00075779A4|nr:DUF4148 domain-containing protein [Burkholderia cepacia]KVL19419.1 hypothetical protein WJ46_15875 [Burkholderia cepacia]KVQ30872.1 hypothetical protein WK02_17565 [Burkholderia cepacia]KVR72652.1 hypothetical protein WK21_12980 [Burkholderia cepacia]KVZ21994.1 hypothetical protein WL14_23355 [Burkholderia cepacia]MDW9248372.1 hypothetical protein [Burkholderia cepacia]
MNKLALYVLATVAATASVSISAWAAPQSTVTRAEVKAELAALRAAGYRQNGEDPYYPARLAEALKKIGSTGTSTADTSGYGMAAPAASESGSMTADRPIYRGR